MFGHIIAKAIISKRQIGRIAYQILRFIICPHIWHHVLGKIWVGINDWRCRTVRRLNLPAQIFGAISEYRSPIATFVNCRLFIIKYQISRVLVIVHLRPICRRCLSAIRHGECFFRLFDRFDFSITLLSFNRNFHQTAGLKAMILGNIAGFGPFEFSILQYRKKTSNLTFSKLDAFLFIIYFDRVDHVTNTLFPA